MNLHEYLALPAPRRAQKVKGLKTASERYAHELTTLLNDLAQEGWEYWRSETLPSEERKGFTGTTIVEHHLLIFRRPRAEQMAEAMTLRPAEAAPAMRAQPAVETGANDRAVYDKRREPQLVTRRPEDSE
jgi:hypothetical protein